MQALEQSSFNIRDSGSSAGSACNEDCWGALASAIWILDGATGLSPDRLFPDAPSDASWFVTAVDRELREADWSGDTASLLSSATTSVARRFTAEAVGNPDEREFWPVGSLALARLNAGMLELANLGDCRILWQERVTGTVHSFGTSAVSTLDAQVIAEIRRLHARGVTNRDEVWQRTMPLMVANRKLKNKPDGYWILDVPGDGLAHLQTMRIPVERVAQILLCTDGYYRLVDTYEAYEDASLLAVSQRGGVAAALEQIRAIEAGDEQCLKFPRMKRSDDATCVVATIAPAR